MSKQGGPWSRGALLLALIGAFSGATLGTIGWATWVVSRTKGLLWGVLAGMLAGLVLATVCRALYEPLVALIAQVPVDFFPAMTKGLGEWIPAELSRVALGELPVALSVGGIARLRRRS
jgi:hypothetical protein